MVSVEGRVEGGSCMLLPSGDCGSAGISLVLNTFIALLSFSIASFMFVFSITLGLLLMASFRLTTDCKSISFVEAPGNLKGFGKNWHWSDMRKPFVLGI